ncbi:MAG: heavy-metal-associated domain-containing protein [Bacteroidota bacterium]
MVTLKFKTNINCGNCVRSVTPHLNSLLEVESWTVNTEHPDKVLLVQSETGDAEEVVEAVRRAGFSIERIAQPASSQ